MKTKLHLTAIIVSFFAFQMNAQNRTTVNAMSSEISDNLDLTAVSSIFGESQNLNDFERRLNDPKLQISNLDLNNDNQVDYLRVIESVENNTHIVIIQSVIGRDLYQDVATIEIEKDRQNRISIQIVGNAYLYGQNYIYEPNYCYTPQIYASFWTSYYKPYYSTWTWNIYPSYYYVWNPYPVYRYRQNVYGCVNHYNTYNYVSYRKCYRAPVICNSYSRNYYERRYPEYAFSRRNNAVNNRYELDQRRYSTTYGSRNVSYSGNNSRNTNYYNSDSQRSYSQNRNSNSRETYNQNTNYQRDNNQSNTVSSRDYNSDRTVSQRDYSQNRNSNSRETNTQNTDNQRDNNQSNAGSSRDYNSDRTVSQRDYSQNRNSNSRETNTQNTDNQRDYSNNRTSAPREYSSERNAPQRDYSQSRNSAPREYSSERATPQRNDSQNSGNSQRGGDYASRGNGRRI